MDEYSRNTVGPDEPVGVTGVSGRHRINQPRGTGAMGSVQRRPRGKTQWVPINRSHSVGLSDHTGRIIRRVLKPRWSKTRVIAQRACWEDEGALCRTGSSDTPSDKGFGALTSALQVQKKKSTTDWMIRRQSVYPTLAASEI